MAVNLTVYIPKAMALELRKRAKRAGLTPSLLVQAVIREALAGEPVTFSDEFAALAGSWEDRRSADEIAHDIRRHRRSSTRATSDDLASPNERLTPLGGSRRALGSRASRIAQERQGREALAAWLGEGRDEPSAMAMARMRAEWRSPPQVRKNTRARRVGQH